MVGIGDFNQKISGKETEIADLNGTRDMVRIVIRFVGIFAI